MTKQRSAATVDASEILRSPVDTVSSYVNLSHYLPRVLAPSRVVGLGISEPSTTVFCPFALLFSPSNPEDVQVDLNFVSSLQGSISTLILSSQRWETPSFQRLVCCSQSKCRCFFVWCFLDCAPSSASHELNFEIQVTPMITWPFFQSLSINAKFLQLLDIATSNGW